MKNFCSLSIVLLTTAVASELCASEIPEQNKIGGFAIGCQAYTFNRFTLFEAIAKTAQSGAKVIEFSVGQNLSPEDPNVKWDHNASDEVIAKVKEQLAKHGIK